MQTLLAILALMGGAILVLLRKVGSLQSDKKISDIKEKDAVLQEKQNNLQEEKAKLEKELKQAQNHKAEDLSDKQIEEYWEKFKK